MRNAALTLGIIAGLLGLLIGFFSYGYVEMMHWAGAEDEVANGATIKLFSVLSPLLALAGGAMARARALWGGVLLAASAGGMYWAFGFNLFTVFPIALSALAAFLAIAAGKPDEPKAHF